MTNSRTTGTSFTVYQSSMKLCSLSESFQRHTTCGGTRTQLHVRQQFQVDTHVTRKTNLVSSTDIKLQEFSCGADNATWCTIAFPSQHNKLRFALGDCVQIIVGQTEVQLQTSAFFK